MKFHTIIFFNLFSYYTKAFFSDCLSKFGFYNYPYRIIFHAGLPKGGSSWMKNLLARIPGYYTRPMPMPKNISTNQDICDSAFKYIPNYGYSLISNHLNPTEENIKCIFKNGVEKVVITYRDPRDVAISNYYWYLNHPYPAHPVWESVDYKKWGKEKSLDHAIEVLIPLSISWIKEWRKITLNNPAKFYTTRFEDLKKDTKKTFLGVLKFYGIQLTEKKVDKLIEESRGKGNLDKNISLAKLSPKGYSSTFRSGKTGSWRGEFTNKQIIKCKELFGLDLIEIGYEKDSNW